MARRCVLLVEDDPSIRRFVAMALEDMALTLVEATTLAEARQVTGGRTISLALCDLMLPDGSGLELLREWQGAGGPARVAVFSAGVGREQRAELVALGAWRILDKPVALAELESCVREALDDPQANRQPSPSRDGTQAAVADAVATYFAGDGALHARFVAQSRPRFASDIASGDAACRLGDAAALRRLAHNLKSVLAMIGWPDLSATAAALEARLKSAMPAGELGTAWRPLRDGLEPLARGADPATSNVN